MTLCCCYLLLCKCPPPANNSNPPTPAEYIYPSPLYYSPPPPDNGPVNIKDENRDNQWDGDLLLVSIACICVAFLLIVTVYYLYARSNDNRLTQRELERRRLRSLRISRIRRASEDWNPASPREGLRRSMVDALPVFFYQPENFTDGLRCAVCLCEFQEKEKARQLPSCKHSFHLDCIDMWFYSHSTCPLCRARVDAQPVQMEFSVIEEEETDNKVSMSSMRGSDAEEQHIQRIEKNGDCCEGEEESGGHAVIDMPTTEN
ncbi:RING-H2 finger protein ATL64 [Cryptomeria japonica]|uniref:RING-H2 finger protein ATL64 n=1 Tax=Cryptomeria japonica TaxID=3369 RepID=UPI0027D9E004|nr:RING-H2 finger protein ATL64 [Cryptomeria japonica]